MRREKVLALDYGTRNIGLAESDELGVTVRPLPSIPNRGRRDLVERLRSRLASAAVDRVVVGLPRNMDGTEGPAAARVRSLIGALEGALGLPVTGVDERLSTVEATEIWRALPARQQRGYRTVDSVAAAIILERFLAGE